jgi:hypothetical protein
MFFAVYFLSGCGKNPREISASTLVAQIPSAWAESTDAFTNVAHKACEAIRKIENPTNRLECAKVYAEALLALDKFIRECDVQGFWARLDAYSNIEILMCDLDVENRWMISARFWKEMKKEFKYIDSRGSSVPMRIIRRYGLSEAEYKSYIKENEKRRKALKYRYYANQIKACLRNLYKPIFECSLKEDCHNMSPERKESLLKMIIEITGETPKWYQEELEENRKTPSTVAK